MKQPSPLIKHILKALLINFFFRPYYFIRTIYPVWLHLLNREGRVLYRKYPPPLDEVQGRIADRLSRDGIAVTNLSELFPDSPNLLAELQAYVANLRQRAKVVVDKPFLSTLLGAYNNRDRPIRFEDPLVKLILHKRMLDIVNTYMQMFTKLSYFTLDVTTPVAPDSSRIKSQRWHRDPEDIKLCKVFVYFSDVSEDSGPFTFVTHSHRGGRWEKVFFQPVPQRVHPSENDVKQAIPAGDIRICTGQAGTVIFCDTSGIHRGGFALEHERIMSTAAYLSSASFVPTLYYLTDEAKDRSVKLHPAARFAVDSKPGPLLGAVNIAHHIQKKYCRY